MVFHLPQEHQHQCQSAQVAVSLICTGPTAQTAREVRDGFAGRVVVPDVQSLLGRG